MLHPVAAVLVVLLLHFGAMGLLIIAPDQNRPPQLLLAQPNFALEPGTALAELDAPPRLTNFPNRMRVAGHRELCLGPESLDEGAHLVTMPCDDERGAATLLDHPDGTYSLRFHSANKVLGADGSPLPGTLARVWSSDGSESQRFEALSTSCGRQIAYRGMCLGNTKVGRVAEWWPCAHEAAYSQMFFFADS